MAKESAKKKDYDCGSLGPATHGRVKVVEQLVAQQIVVHEAPLPPSVVKGLAVPLQ